VCSTHASRMSPIPNFDEFTVTSTLIHSYVLQL
jgi:hypothetical protein